MSEETASESRSEPPRDMTPEEISEAFRRYDLIIAIGVVLMAFFAASFQASIGDLYGRMVMGRFVAQSFPSMPKVADFTYTAPADVSAVNPSWLLDLGIFGLWNIHDWALVIAKVAVVVLTAILLLGIRLPGPTRGWHAFCVALAIVASVAWLDVGPAVVTNLMVAAILWIWHRSQLGSSRWLPLTLAPLSILWANLDPSFFLAPALIVPLALSAVMSAGIRSSQEETNGAAWLIAGGVSLIAGIVSPFGLANVTYVWQWLTHWSWTIPAVELQVTGWTGILRSLGERSFDWGDPTWIATFAWLLLGGLAVISTVLNYRRLSWGLVIAALLVGLSPIVSERLLGAAGIALAVLASRNFQQAYLSRYGAEVRTGLCSLVWSQATRVVLILLLFVGLIAALTGRLQGEPARFGFSTAQSEFMVTGANWLAESPLEGNAFSISPTGRLAPVTTWADPARKAFLDLRWPWVGDAYAQYAAIRSALVAEEQDQEVTWRKGFAEHGVSLVILDARDESASMRDARFHFSRRSEVAPVHADDQCIIHGWLGEKSPERATVQRLQMRTNTMAFREPRDPPPPTERDTVAPGVADWIWPLRTATRPPGLDTGTFFSLGGHHLAQPGAAILATAHLRSAVSANPDNPDANLRLGIAYQQLAALEMSRLPEISAATPEQPQMHRLFSQTIPMRHHQMMVSLRNAELAGAQSHGLYKALQDACEASEFKDMALHYARLQQSLELTPQQRQTIEGDNRRLEKEIEELRSLYEKQVEQRSQELRTAADDMQKRSEEAKKSAESAAADKKEQLRQDAEVLMRQAEALRSASELPRRLENSQYAFGHRLAQLAIEELEMLPAVSPEARAGAEWAVRLYLMVGDVKRARERLPMVQDQPGVEPGIYQWLLAQVHVVSGQFENAAMALEGAIANVRFARSYAAIEGLNYRARTGEWMVGMRPVLLMEINDEIRYRSYEANYLYDLSMVRLELAQADKALKSMEEVLEVASDFSLWAVMDFYHRAVMQKGLPRPTIPNPEDEIIRRFEAPAESTPPGEPAPSTPPANPPPADTTPSAPTPPTDTPATP